jgi:hypothetical protein
LLLLRRRGGGLLLAFLLVCWTFVLFENLLLIDRFGEIRELRAVLGMLLQMTIM